MNLRDRVLAFVGIVAIALTIIVGVTNNRIDPPRCAKVKGTVIRDTVWVMGEPMPEKDLDCKCLVEEQR